MQELLRLPAVTGEVLAGFEVAMMGTRSERDQRNHIKRLLFNSGACIYASLIMGKLKAALPN